MIGRIRRRLAYQFQTIVCGRLQEQLPGTTVYSIALYAGESPHQLYPAPGIRNPTFTREDVTDVEAVFVADPFMIYAEGQWHMFFEVYNRHSGKGEIGYAVSQTLERWTYKQIVLRERFHISYPYVFQWEDQFYMVPEVCATQAVRLYRAESFPLEWVAVGDLLTNIDYADPSPFWHNDAWWMFLGHGRQPFRADNLRLFRAEALRGPWREHPRSPVVRRNPHFGRPGGRVVSNSEGLFRYSQDCQPIYGTRVWAFKVEELTANSYREINTSTTPLLSGSGSGWNADGMHHIDAHQQADRRWIACVDGWFLEPFSSFRCDEQNPQSPCE